MIDHIRQGSVVAAPDQVSCDLAGETALLHLKSGVYFGLNDVGTLVWNLVQEPRSFAALRDAILKEYDVAPDRCEHDLLALIEELSTAGLVEIRDAPVP